MHAVALVPLFPLAGFVLLLLFGRRLGDPLAGWLGTLAIVASFVAALVCWVGLLDQPSGSREFTENLFDWISVGGLSVHVGFLLDPLSVSMILFVTGVAALIHLYSIGYMARDPQFAKFFLYLNLFVFSMLLLVLGDNLLLTFVGWEGVGVCSYWLVSFWFVRPSAASAGKKAFIYNRAADFGFLLGMFLLFDHTGTLNYSGIFAAAAQGRLSGATVTAASLLLFLAAVGKSAQIPFYPWLVDAMEGPTPVSALIHAATMVTAGVYLMCRMSPVLALSSSACTVVAVIGGVTALVAAAAAVAQSDIKRVLAYSTVSQLGYMFLAVGVRAYVAAIFLMIAHAFYKALLFLGAGSAIHGMNGEQDLKRMGGLRRLMPLTAVTFLIGWLAIGGIPPLGGFWAKGDVLVNAWEDNIGLWALGAVTAVLTAYYIGRETMLAFYGDQRWRKLAPQRPAIARSEGPGESYEDADHRLHPHDPSAVMRLPLVILAVGSILVGVADLPFGSKVEFLSNWLSPFFGTHLRLLTLSGVEQFLLEAVDAVLGVAGVWLAVSLWRTRSDNPALEPAILEMGWGLDAYNNLVFSHGGQALATAADATDRDVIDGTVVGLARLVQISGRWMRGLESGYVRRYLLAITVGAVLILGWALTRASL